MANRKRKSYDDKFRASAVVMLEAAGYPDTKGALQRTSDHLHVPARTLSRWFNGESNPPPDNTVKVKRGELKDLIREELYGILESMPSARKDADYRELGTVAGIFFDKLQLLEGKPTDRHEINVNDSRERLARLITDKVERQRALGDTGFTH